MEKIIHQIWVGPYRMPRREKELCRKMKEAHPDWEYMFWDDYEVSKLSMPQNVRDSYDFYGNIHGYWEIGDYVAQADILRFFLVYNYGGVYLDVDFEVVKGLQPLHLEEYDAFICHHEDARVETFPNGAMGSKKNQKLFEYIITNMKPNNHYTPHQFALQVRNYYGIDYKTSTHHGDSGVLNLFKKDNIFYINYDKFHNENCYHHALYSWSNEGKEMFKRGTYE